MHTSIEPRLISLIHEDTLDSLIAPPLELPPLHNPNITKASGRPLLLEPDAASTRTGESPSNSMLAPQHAPLLAADDDRDTRKNGVKDGPDRASGSYSPQSLRRILDDAPGTVADLPSKKRHIPESGKDDFVQLPQPPKKHKAAKQVVPPIIIGLFEPPPQAALFPPIASSSFHDSHGRNSLNTVLPKVKEPREEPRETTSSDLPAISGESTTADAKATESQNKKAPGTRKKWTEQETNHLLLGVHKYGVGKWTDILEDSSFVFNNRSGVDLKDRFRTCCPVELRGKTPRPRKFGRNAAKASDNIKANSGQSKSRSSLMSENILIEEDKDDVTNNTCSNRQSRAHRKNLSDLAQLGIEGPFRKSQRRERRPFTDEDDRAILQGYNIYGPSWTRIQKDPRFQLQTRQPTDLRDRFRNKYPQRLRNGGEAQPKDTNNSTDDQGKMSSTPTVHLSTSATQSSSNRQHLKIQEVISPNQEEITLKIAPVQQQANSRHNPSEQSGIVEPTDGMPFSQAFDWSENPSPSFSVGGMDISRLLLDETWSEPIGGLNGRPKQSFTDINSLLTSSSEILPQGPSFYNMPVCDPEQMVTLPSSATTDSSFG
ncbi:hypothetical protein B7494_g8181 [Chlorociboria aeruginascens]|nr:hypothetical protein B7494_g8181 [Chlorociboria aeruginascens]